MIWSYLRNPAYKGTAGFGKTPRRPQAESACARNVAVLSSPGVLSLGSIHLRKSKSPSTFPGW